MHLHHKPSTPSSPRDFMMVCAPLMVWAILIGIQAFTSLKPPLNSPQPNPTLEQPSEALVVPPKGHTVLVIIDSLRRESIDAHMPTLQAFEREHTSRVVDTCTANFTLVCVQTMLEGRQSPFVASLHNFTGKEGSIKSIPGAMERAGRPLHMISDYTLDSLYGSMANASMNVETWQGDHLEHDLRAIDITMEWLEREDTDLIILHLVGTDKAAHRLTPGHPDYAHHFAQVDAALAPLIQAIDPDRDHLVITGDHGHDEKGHHTKQSVVMAKSELLEPLLSITDSRIDQTEIAYLIAVAAKLDLHLDYEGRYFGLESHREEVELNPAARRTIQQFEAAQIEAMRRASYHGQDFAELAAHKDRARAERSWRTLARVFPLILLYFLWLTLIAASWRSPPHVKLRVVQSTIMISALAVGLWLISGVLAPWIMAIMSVSMLAGMGYLFLATPLRRVWRLSAAIWIIMIVAASISLTGGSWRAFFHTPEGFTWQMVLFFGGIIALGLVLSRLYSGSATHTLPAMTTALGIWALPSGVYYYQFGQNIAQSTCLGAGALLAATLWRRREQLPEIVARLRQRPRVLGMMAALVGVVALLLWQDAEFWVWTSGLVAWLEHTRPEVAMVLFVLLSLGFLGTLRTRLWRVVAGINVLVIAGYGVLMAELGWAVAVSVMVVALALSLSLRLEVELRELFADGKPACTLDDEQSGIWSAAIILMLAWTMLEGFFIENVAFNFTFDYVKGLKHESEVAAASAALTYFKYAPALWLGAVAIMERHEEAWGKTLRVVLWAFHVKLLMLLVQIAFGAVNATEKLHELATSDLMFVLGVLLHFLTGAILTSIIARFAQWRRSKTP